MRKSHICPICFQTTFLDKFSIKCNHYFCKVCLEKWEEINSSCPICRYPKTKLEIFLNNPFLTIYQYIKLFWNNYSEFSDFMIDQRIIL